MQAYLSHQRQCAEEFKYAFHRYCQSLGIYFFILVNLYNFKVQTTNFSHTSEVRELRITGATWLCEE